MAALGEADDDGSRIFDPRTGIWSTSLKADRAVPLLMDDDVRISVTDATGQLTELVGRAEAGDEIIVTRHRQAIVRFVPAKVVPRPEARKSLLEAARMSGAAKATDGPHAARSQDFLYLYL
jgi:antitoxin (DNA-binding transcriptional repressor) of toxin-antitoxin stability system